MGFPGGSDGKKSACNAGDLGLIPGLGTSSGEGNGNPLQYARLENSMDRGAWPASVHGVVRVGHNYVTNTFTFRTLYVLQIWRKGSYRRRGELGTGGGRGVHCEQRDNKKYLTLEGIKILP